ncbi:mannosylglycoprotein endo-beta-mannosidase [Trifolium repens]|nr:mannosylglycoprotein endo-beta-mannosidase [Trifolium repens]
MIGKDVATQYVQGWDWIAPIRDRNTGIWDEVSIVITGPVKIIDPHLVSSFFDNYKRVYLHATTELENRSSWTAECSLSIHVTTELEIISNLTAAYCTSIQRHCEGKMIWLGEEFVC